MSLSDTLGIIAIIFSIMSLLVNFYLNKKLTKFQHNLSMRENNRLYLAKKLEEMTHLFKNTKKIEKEILDNAIYDDNNVQESHELLYNIMDSVRSIVLLFEDSKSFYSVKTKNKIENRIKKWRKMGESKNPDNEIILKTAPIIAQLIYSETQKELTKYGKIGIE